MAATIPQPGLKSSSERQLVYAMRRLSTSVPVVGPLLHRYARKAGKKVYGTEHTTIRSGNWYGNDTTWRMCLDLNKLCFTEIWMAHSVIRHTRNASDT
jgi:hypothetical protein